MSVNQQLFLLSLSVMVTVAVSRPGVNKTFGSFESAETEKDSGTSTRVSSLRGMLTHLLSPTDDPAGKRVGRATFVKSISV